MITVHPYADYMKTAEVLDPQTLGKQRIENFTLIQLIVGYKLITRNRRGVLDRHKWKIKPVDPKDDAFYVQMKNEPVFAMWQHNVRSLFEYQTAICTAFIERVSKDDDCLMKTEMVFDAAVKPARRAMRPNWIRDERLHMSHRVFLLKRNTVYYLPYFGNLPRLPLYWPVN